MSPEPAETTEVTSPPPAPRAPRRPGVRVRLGPLVLPSAAVAWGASIAAHGAVLLVALSGLRSTDSGPAIALRAGDGGDGGLGSTFSFSEGSAFAPHALAPAAMPPPPASNDAPGDAVPAAVEEDAAPISNMPGDTAADVTPEVPAEVPLLSLGPIGRVPGDAPFQGGRTAAAASGGGGNADSPDGVSGESTVSGQVTGAGAGAPGPGRSGGDGAGTPGVPGGLAVDWLPAPVYPRESRLRREQGTVYIEVDVAADGSVTAARVADDAGYPRLAAAALDAARKAAFRPVARDGRAIPCRYRVPFRFRLR